LGFTSRIVKLKSVQDISAARRLFFRERTSLFPLTRNRAEAERSPDIPRRHTTGFFVVTNGTSRGRVMEITEIGLSQGRPGQKLRHMLRSLLIMPCGAQYQVHEGKDHAFIAMPSRKLRFPCPKCSFKNEIESRVLQQMRGIASHVREEDLQQGLAWNAKLNHRGHRRIPSPKTSASIFSRASLRPYKKDISSGPQTFLRLRRVNFIACGVCSTRPLEA